MIVVCTIYLARPHHKAHFCPELPQNPAKNAAIKNTFKLVNQTYFEEVLAADVPSTPGVYPHKFHQLERFFKDLKSDFGRRIQDPGLAQEPLLDIFILCTRRGSRWGETLVQIYD